MELAQLRARVGQLEHEANQGKAASQIISDMIASGVAAQDDDSNVVVNAAGGEKKFKIGA